MNWIKKNSLGIILCIAISALSSFLSTLNIGSFSLEIIGAPVFAIITGMIISLALPEFSSHKKLKDGIKFTSKKILQWAVIILGFSLNLSTILKVGGKSMPVIISTIGISLITAFVLMKILKINKKTACLIGVGSSICGGSAIAATAPVIDADDEDVAQAISVIFLFNVLAIFAGTAVNDTSSVTSTASTAEGIYGTDGILASAVTVKLTRTLAIIPITLALAVYRAGKAKKSERKADNFSLKKIFPFFIIFFILASVITTVVGIIPENSFTKFYNESFVSFAKWLAKFFIAMAMCAIGLNTNIVKLIKNGKKPILLGLCCWIMITSVSVGVQLATGIFYTNL